MNTIGAIKARIKRLCFENDITLNKLANLCGVSPSSIKNIMYGKSCNPKCKFKGYPRIADITLADFFNTKEFNSLEQELK